MAEVTCWTLIESAADGDRVARDAFARRYLPVVHAYLRTRWKGRLGRFDLEDATQEVFLECLKREGILDRSRTRRGTSFRNYLLGAVRNVALRMEEGRARRLDPPRTDAFQAEQVSADDASSSRAFDRAWAAALVGEAAELQSQRAHAEGPLALRRVELLRLIFEEERKIVDIAREWGVPPDSLRREYAKGRSEFAAALQEVVAFHVTESDAAVERECRDLMGLLQ